MFLDTEHPLKSWLSHEEGVDPFCGSSKMIPAQHEKKVPASWAVQKGVSCLKDRQQSLVDNSLKLPLKLGVTSPWMFRECSISINWSIHLVSTGTVLNAQMFLFIYCKGKNSVSRPLQFGQLELSRMELPTLDKGQDTNPRSYQIHNPQSYTGPWFYNPIVRWGPVWAEFPITRLGLAEKSSPYWILK